MNYNFFHIVSVWVKVIIKRDATNGSGVKVIVLNLNLIANIVEGGLLAEVSIHIRKQRSRSEVNELGGI